MSWDYHVVLLSFQEGWWVWDLDTTLGLPVRADAYFPKTFLRSAVDVEHVDVVLRLIAAGSYVSRFSSDRSHMRLPTGAWIAPPPPWPPILQEGEPNLLQLLDVRRDAPGQVVTLATFMRDFLDRTATF